MKCWCGGRAFLNLQNEAWCQESKFHDPLATGRPDVIQKLYLAGPMSGYPDCNHPAFAAAATQLRNAGYEVVSPPEINVDRCHYTDLIREDLRFMLDCHAVATIENWWESVGARNEIQVAGILKMPIRTVSEWYTLKL